MRQNILSLAELDGLSLKLTCDGHLSYSGYKTTVERWMPTLKALKLNIIEALIIAANDPVIEKANEITVDRNSCLICTHLAKPGKSDGYCDQRHDLPPAYGANHPLHKLPDDAGESCASFKEYTQ